MSHCKSTKEVALTLGISQPTAFRKMKKHGLEFKSIQK
jgi:predicted DNA-binding transcriptional regulator AlpA